MERKVSIILPTLNEEQNVYKIVQEIKLKLKQKFEIIFVDDDSNDGTQERIEELKTKYDNIKSIFRKEKNLSTAFLDGLKIASGEYIVLMDSDLQHDPINIEKALSIIYEKKEQIFFILCSINFISNYCYCKFK